MAFTLGDAVVFLSTDNSKLESGLGDAEKKTESSVGNMAKMVGGGLVAGAALAGTAILAIGGKAFDVASDIDAATDQIGASLGLSATKAKAYGQTIKDVYANNFGNSIEDVGAAIENVAKQLKLTAADPALKTMTENAFRLRDVFGTEVNESVDAAKTLMDNFGISGQEAFDLIAEGYRVGLDRSGDFLDTIGEYSVQFAEGGASAVEFFSALDTGLQGGMLGTDKAADAFKEFRVRIADGSATTATALEQIGLSAETITTGLSSGALTVKDAWDLVQKALLATQDPVAQMQAGVGLIGTQFEDLGAKVVLGMDLTEDWADGGVRSINELDSKYTNLGSAVEGFWRKFEVGIAPAGELMLDFVNENMPAFSAAVDIAAQAVVGFIATIPLAISDMRKKWDEDYAGMQTTLTNFQTEAGKKQQEFWAEWNLTFKGKSSENKSDWEDFYRSIIDSGTESWLLIVDGGTNMLRLLRGNWAALHALMIGDWEGFWAGLNTAMEGGANVILDFVQYVFDVNLRNALAGAFQHAFDDVKVIANGFTNWWNNYIGSWSGLNISVPGMGVVNPANTTSPNQQVIDDILRGGGYPDITLPQSNSATVNNNIIVQQTGGSYDQGFSTGEGILDAMRYAGY